MTKLVDWGRTATSHSEYRWQKESKEIISSLVGSTISVKTFPLDARTIKVEDGRALLMYEFSRDKFYEEPVFVGLTTSYTTRPHKFRWARLTLRDTSDRLALEISGEGRIDVVGRIAAIQLRGSEYGYDADVELVVDITTWAPSK